MVSGPFKKKRSLKSRRRILALLSADKHLLGGVGRLKFFDVRSKLKKLLFLEPEEVVVPDPQAGIYWNTGQSLHEILQSRSCVLRNGATAGEVGRTLLVLADLWNKLVKGIVPDLPGITMPSANLAWLIGYSRKVFNLRGVAHGIPHGLGSPYVTAPVLRGRGGPVFNGAGIHYSKELITNPGTEEMAVQFTGDTPLSVSRAVVETWKLLERLPHSQDNAPALMLVASFTGFNREDHRSWIGFHDGISNMKPGMERKSAIVVRRTGLIRSRPLDRRWIVFRFYAARSESLKFGRNLARMLKS